MGLEGGLWNQESELLHLWLGVVLGRDRELPCHQPCGGPGPELAQVRVLTGVRCARSRESEGSHRALGSNHVCDGQPGGLTWGRTREGTQRSTARAAVSVLRLHLEFQGLGLCSLCSLSPGGSSCLPGVTSKTPAAE